MLLTCFEPRCHTNSCAVKRFVESQPCLPLEKNLRDSITQVLSQIHVVVLVAKSQGVNGAIVKTFVW